MAVLPRSTGWIALGLVGLAACGVREPVPPFRAHDARFGLLGGRDRDRALPPTAKAICKEWKGTIVARDGWAATHLSFPETNVQAACFTPVTHAGREVRAAAAPSGCSYPDEPARARLEALAGELEALASGRDGPGATTTHNLFPCALPEARRVAAARQNARALRALARRKETHPYAAILVPGHGLAEQDDTALASFLPGESCRDMSERDLVRLGVMPRRAARAADAMRGSVAPVAIVSGGAVHSHVIEAFALMHLLQCREGVETERVVVEPCAEHTHTNLRNGGRWIEAMNGRAAYLVTDDGIQADYFQDYSGFELILGTIDQRSLRDWGYVLGAWRQASIGTNAGFWFTPYRFWAEPRGELGSVTCVDEPQ